MKMLINLGSAWSKPRLYFLRVRKYLKTVPFLILLKWRWNTSDPSSVWLAGTMLSEIYLGITRSSSSLAIRLGRMWKKEAVTYYKASMTSQNLPGECKESHETLSQKNWLSGRKSKHEHQSLNLELRCCQVPEIYVTCELIRKRKELWT
jgi:hypothetical protein